jgi:hypothetical protein
VPTTQIVEALDKLEDRHLRLSVGLEATALEQFALEGGKEALGHRIVIGIAYRTHRGAHACLPAAVAEGERGIL